MEQLRLITTSGDIVITQNIEVAGSWFSRLKGLLGKEALPENSCLVLYPCNSVHTCFMKFNIDVLFVNREGVIVHLIENMLPYKFSPVVRNARFVIEMPAYTINSKGIVNGNRLNISEEILKKL